MTAVLLDVGGVLVLPDLGPVAGVLAGAGLDGRAAALDRAHYAAVMSLDRPFPTGSDDLVDAYVAGFVAALDTNDARDDLAVAVEHAFGSTWSRTIDGSVEAMRTLSEMGHRIALVSNSQGHVEEGLRGICQVGDGPGAPVDAIVDSSVVGFEKPDPRIFALALAAIGGVPSDAIHVGDSIVYDVRGAQAAGVRAVHLDPWRDCHADDHEHATTLTEIVEAFA